MYLYVEMINYKAIICQVWHAVDCIVNMQLSAEYNILWT